MKKLLFGISLLLVPFMVNAAVDATTPSRGAEVASDANIKTDVENDLAKNESIKNVVRGFYIEGFSVDCVSGKNKLTYLNDRLSNNLVCANGNKTPYIETIADGTSSFADGSTCTTDGTNYAYATRVIKYDCLLKDDKSEYVKPSEPATTSSNKDDDTTTSSKPTGTTENKDTGVEDYFITLGVIGASVTAVLYILDKKNSFKKI